MTEWERAPDQLIEGTYPVSWHLGEVTSSADPRFFAAGSNRRTDIIQTRYLSKTTPKERGGGWMSPLGVEEGSRRFEELVLQFKFDREQLFNRFYMELAGTYVNWSVWYFDLNRQMLVQLADEAGNFVGGFNVGTYEREGPGPFSFIDQKLPPTKTTHAEIHLSRTTSHTGSSRSTSQALAITQGRFQGNESFAYHGISNEKPPVAVRNVLFDYEITSRNELPAPDEDIRIVGPLGHIERLVVKEWNASQATDGQENTFWQCEPQPVPQAVTNLYLDVRSAGAAQALDALEIDPVYSGVYMNIYYTNDDLLPPSLANSADVGSSANVLTNPTLLLDSNEDGEPDNWNFAEAAGGGKTSAIVLSEQAAEITSSGSLNPFYFQRIGASEDEIWTLQAEAKTQSGSNGWHLYLEAQDATFTFLDSWSTSFTTSSEYERRTLTSGAMPANTAYLMVVLQHEGTSGVTRFRKSQVEAGEVATNYNLSIDENYDLKEWIPIQRNYILRKGTYSFPPITAKFLKLEFYNLSEEPYPVWEEGVKKVYKEFPQWVHQHYAAMSAQSASIPYAPKATTEYRWERQAVGTYTLEKAWVRTNHHFGTPPYSYGKYEGKAPTEFEMHLDLALKSAAREPHPIFGGVQILHTYTRTFTKYAQVKVPYTVLDYTDADFATVIQQQVVPKQFFRVVRHEYDEREITVENQVAYFVGIREVKAFRTDYAIGEDTPEYLEAFMDEKNIATNDWTRDPTGHLYSTAADEVMETKTLPSLSTFKSLQMAVQGSQWESQMSDAQMSMLTYAHITDTANTTREEVSDQFEGEGGGNVLQFTPTTPGAGDYGTKTNSGIFQSGGGRTYDSVADAWVATTAYGLGETVRPTADNGRRYQVIVSGTSGAAQPTWPTTTHATVVDGGVTWQDVGPISYDSDAPYDTYTAVISERSRTSAMVRMILPDTSLGTYELRLYERGVLVTKKSFRPPARKWHEEILYHLTGLQDTDFQVEIVQVDDNVSEPFGVDFLGIFQNPVRWEVSNDGGTTWQVVNVAINNPDAYVTFPAANKQLKVRATALREGAVLSSFSIVPWYEESPLVSRLPLDYVTPWGDSDDGNLRAVRHKPLFSLWSRIFPQRYSLDQVGIVPLSGEGFQP